jgi:hypothetical protein
MSLISLQSGCMTGLQLIIETYSNWKGAQEEEEEEEEEEKKRKKKISLSGGLLWYFEDFNFLQL